MWGGIWDSPTLMLFFALVSTQAALFASASLSPSDVSTCRLRGAVRALPGPPQRTHTHLCWRSVLEPTITHGMSLTPQKSMILSYTIWTMSNELREVME